MPITYNLIRKDGFNRDLLFRCVHLLQKRFDWSLSGHKCILAGEQKCNIPLIRLGSVRTTALKPISCQNRFFVLCSNIRVSNAKTDYSSSSRGGSWVGCIQWVGNSEDYVMQTCIECSRSAFLPELLWTPLSGCRPRCPEELVGRFGWLDGFNNLGGKEQWKPTSRRNRQLHSSLLCLLLKLAIAQKGAKIRW